MNREDIETAGEEYAISKGINFSGRLPHLWIDFALEMVRQHNEELQKLVPTNWLDPLLTGPDKVGEYTAAIEPLLRAVQQRLREAKP